MHVKVKKLQRQDILRFHADERKLILRSIGTPLDHLSVKVVVRFDFNADLFFIICTLYEELYCKKGFLLENSF